LGCVGFGWDGLGKARSETRTVWKFSSTVEQKLHHPEGRYDNDKKNLISKRSEY
jgi:hypothetical protein